MPLNPPNPAGQQGPDRARDARWLTEQFRAVAERNSRAQPVPPARPERLAEIQQAVIFDEAPELAELPKVKKQTNDTVLNTYGISVPQYITNAMSKHVGQNLFGVELEIEAWPTAPGEASATGFSFTTDGSLRNNGIEAVSHATTLQGVISNTSRLWTKYNITDANFSERCSIHVHANVLDFNTEKLQVLALTYSCMEGLIFNFVGHDRDNNIFCVPWREAGINGRTAGRIIDAAPRWAKYTALNLAPVSTQGTVEFRHMYGHADLALFTTWLNIIDELMTFSKTKKLSELEDEIKALNTNSEYLKFMQQVFPKQCAELCVKDWESVLASGVIESKFLMVV